VVAVWHDAVVHSVWCWTQ